VGAAGGSVICKHPAGHGSLKKNKKKNKKKSWVLGYPVPILNAKNKILFCVLKKEKKECISR
jgi:hypothetical protein